MGSIRPQNVKRTAEDMVDENPNQFTRDFHENRELLKTKADFSSKKTLNSVAGYVTRYIIKLETRKKRELEEFGATEIP
ncbi:MAG: 30S ribosomal protein S17e [Candidatus Thermoplasmatota archaeon]|nr:30S ribosomal protein S17e [Candidatus Thermoplasmatota archaeon]